ncbi:Aste57867_20670 [Aphanomyces stellatus]|uniref:Aste57867_20670 protein n=1 Tax=Aphanomyces stellatus TaxID=120398 RepID=A0A485LK78_9STRA|nr:hypothetical protein As57867_020602 [Aphanomyces stellatus]VFT97350.1 Aste57867_20670 [Aphanomyces stellatus]
MLTQYCWVDLAKAFEVAHSTRRQERCASQYHANGAVYFEMVLRNQIWDDLIAYYAGDGAMFTIAILSWLEQVPAGQEWLATTAAARATTTVAQKRCIGGVDETMEIENALGVRSTITLKRLGYTTATWTSMVMYWAVLYDLYFMASLNRSLVRSAKNSLTLPPIKSPKPSRLVSGNGGTVLVFRYVLRGCACCSLDLVRCVSFPPRRRPDIIGFVGYFRRHSNHRQPTPHAWSNSNHVFYGGNPMCLYHSALPYVQDTFSFSDPCVTLPPLLVTATKYSSLFAAMALGNQFQPSATCALQSLVPNCLDSLQTVGQVAQQVAPFAPAALDALTALTVGIMQFAANSNGTRWTLLQQSLHQADEPEWVFYGWIMLYDWVQGKREVVSFEGDLMTLTLISSASTPQLFSSNANSISVATRLIYYLVGYTTFILGVLGIACVLGSCLLRLQVHGPNLFWFNRIVSSIWIGRPLVFIRGVTAILMLSTTQLSMGQGSSPTSTRFVFAPRPWYATMVIAGEVTWVLYATQDVLTIFTQYHTPRYTPWCSVLAWLALVGLETQWPILPSGEFKQLCVAKNMDETLTCSGSLFRIGSLGRVSAILGILGASMVIAIVFTTFNRQRKGVSTPRHLLGIADYFLAAPKVLDGHWSLDKVSCLMAGLVHVSSKNVHYTFDIKLWVVSRDKQITRGSTKSFGFHLHQLENTASSSLPSLTTSSQAKPFLYPLRWLKQISVVFGMMYAIGSIVGCVSYLQVSRVALANDMFWTSFNMTGFHTFLGTWLNTQLVLGTNKMDIQLNAPYINQDGSFDNPTGAVVAVSNFGGLMQYSEMNSIEDTIRGLRQTDACAVPWIFTQYCFVDFNQTWELANSATRQMRCRHMTTNGAVFLESILRNIRFDEFSMCWGAAFDSAIANDLRRTAVGQIWLSTIASPVQLSIPREIEVWQTYRIEAFVTQWQNFKRVGLINTYHVQNVFGMSYSFSLQNQETTFRLNEQSTFKMYWGLASDFAAVAPNSSSSLRGLSLIRSSPAFAFANTTIQTILVQNGTLVAPLVASFGIFSNTVGPFGSIDMRFLPCPAIVKETLRLVKATLRTILSQNSSGMTAYTQITDPSATFWSIPQAWVNINFLTLGGDPTCPQLPLFAAMAITMGLQTLLSASIQCNSVASYESYTTSRETLIESIVLGNLSTITSNDIVRICDQNIGFEHVCQQFLTQTVAFVTTFMGSYLNALAPYVLASNTAIQALNIELIQYGQQNSSFPVLLYRLKLLDPEHVDFTGFTWSLLSDWAVGIREVVTFEGDTGTLTVLTHQMSHFENQVNVAEMPTALAFYLRNTVYYITGAMIGIASIMLLYVLISHGMVEVLNCLELQRVGALVWIGRPLLVVRSLTAVALLSTSTLQLVFNGSISYFDVIQDPWYKTLLAANEITWMVAIVNDIAMALTQDYTAYYATANSILVWLVVMTWSFASPIRHSMSINKQCQLTQVDFQVVCESASITIGLVVDEDCVSKAVVLQYIRTIGGWPAITVTVLPTLASNESTTLSPAAFADKTTSYMLVYGLLTAATVVYPSIHLFCLHGAKTLFADMLQSLLEASIAFLDTNPIGRLLNRIDGVDIATVGLQKHCSELAIIP